MKFTQTELRGAYMIDIDPRFDERGFFARAWCQKEFEDNHLITSFVQSNIAGSKKKGTLRGMHYQLAPHGEVKLIRCLRGSIFDVMIDLRPNSDTYMHWFGIELTEQSHRMVYVPESFAHGYLTLCDDTEVFYQVSAFYSPGAECGIRWDDPVLGITWPITDGLIISEKDRTWSLIQKQM